MHTYGIDIGSVSLKLAEFIDDRLTKTEYLLHKGRPFNFLFDVLKNLDKVDRLILTGSVTRHLKEILGAVYINEVEAAARGVIHFHPEARSIIEIGGEDSKLINISNKAIKDFASNTICAAGTGIFLDQQAKRLCFDIEEFGRVALESKNPARIAGRCSVFAKSDMIHLQQIGTEPEDLIAGLCLAMARNFKSVIVQGKAVSAPVAFIGGVAANCGIVQAIQKTLKISSKQLIIPEHYNCVGAIGAVLCASNLDDVDYKGLDAFNRWLSQPRLIKRLAPLDGQGKPQPAIKFCSPKEKTKVYLGIDVGSISTNLVLIDEGANVLARRYMWTKGRPLEVVLQGLSELKKECGEKAEIIGAGTTGSGRYLVGEFVGADIIKNEISAQARAAIEIAPDVDTIFEIGGQDSKFISLNNKTIVDFEMNKVCAAGTGSFLEEQAQILGVKLDEFGDIALKAKSPINLGERCTVFIGSEVVNHQVDSAEQENLLAGLGYSIVFNYLNRVVNGKHIGNKIFFQGGVAANKAVVSAFEQVLKKEINVPLNYDITGAIGIALLTREADIKKSKFRGFELTSRRYESASFICPHCSNECEVNKITIEGEKSIYYGGRCERYENKDKSQAHNLPDFFKLRNEIFFKTQEIDGIEIGIPRCLIYYELFPFFCEFLKELGFKPVLSEPTTHRIIELGSEISVADTCLPIKVAVGHIRSLLNQGIKRCFLPSIITMPPNDEEFSRCFVCPYVQTIPYLARALLDREVEIFSPYIYFDRGKEGVEKSLFEFAKQFGKTEKQTKKAVAKAMKHQYEIQQEIEKIGKDVLKKIEDFAFVVCSRPYNGYDLGMNLDLPKKIRDLGVLPIPIDFIPLNYRTIKDDFSNMYWHYGQRILAAAETISSDERLFAVYLSNFSCGPDSFLSRFFKEKLGEKAFLLIEIDEHSGDAGFITRCEAFHDSIKGAKRQGRARKIKIKSEVRKEKTIYIPDMCDSAKVLASAMKYAGVDARVLPPPDEESVIIGRQFTSGRECLPAIITAGDMIKKIVSPDFDPQRSAFFMAQGSGPCRFGQYYKLHRIILDDFGFSDIPIYAPNQGPSLFDDLGPMGLKFLTSAWDGICAIDALEAISRMTRSYERHVGTTDAVYKNTLDKICHDIEQGKGIIKFLKKTKEEFDKIKMHNDIKKPKVGIVGEIYVRSQTFSNNFLIKKLEELGCEVVVPSIAEWFFYTNFTRMKNCWWFRQYRRVIFTKVFDRYMAWRHNLIYKIFGLASEAEVIKLLNYAEKILHPSFEGEAILSIGKTLEFINESFSGVVNVMPFTCMPGNIVTTLYKTIKNEHPNFPLLVLPMDGLDHSVDAMRLETFVSQARSYHLTN